MSQKLHITRSVYKCPSHSGHENKRRYIISYITFSYHSINLGLAQLWYCLDTHMRANAINLWNNSNTHGNLRTKSNLLYDSGIYIIYSVLSALTSENTWIQSNCCVFHWLGDVVNWRTCFLDRSSHKEPANLLLLDQRTHEALKYEH